VSRIIIAGVGFLLLVLLLVLAIEPGVARIRTRASKMGLRG